MDSPIQRGYLVLADISGYTAFLAGSELDHAQGILSNLLTLLIDRLTPTLKFAEVEGDAVFVYAPDSTLTRGETLLEVIEDTYAAFRDRQKTMQRNATCPCAACHAIPTLDLKFVTHSGEYVVQDVAGTHKPLGSCVNLAHRLLKNRVRESTGWRGYALFSEESLRHLGVWPAEIHPGVEQFEHLGEVRTCSINLDRQYQERTEERRVFLSPEEADISFSYVFAAPPPVVWDWLNDPPKRTAWMKGSEWQSKARPQGRTAPGAQNHCSTTRFIEHVLDWRPFDYFTVRYRRGPLNILITGELEAVVEGTRVCWNMRLEGGLPRSLLRPSCKFIARRLMQVERCFEALEQLMDEATMRQEPASSAASR